MQDEISFGKWLRKQRRVRDLTRQAFADQIGCAEVTVRRIEAGTLKPSKELAGIILKKLGIPEVERPRWISFARGLSGLPGSSLASSNKPNSNLPAPLTTFIGRENEKAEVIRLITKHRLVTLTGSGGVGKTRLSIKVGEQALEDYPDGVWLMELAPILDPSLVPVTAVRTFGLHEDPKRLIIDILCDYLREKSILLILDNCEHVLDACAQLADTLLKRCLGLKILTTSREGLGILGEAVYPVSSLELPNVQQLVDEIRDYESIRLFEERAQLAQRNFSLTIENASSVAKICTQLDGIPLAIELAAARMSTFSTEEIAERLRKNFNLLSTGNRTALPRHQTLHAAIDWSYDLLSSNEKILFQRLSIFVKSWTLEAAASICSDDNINSELTLNMISKLISKSLLIMEETPVGTRYRMLETIRQYAYEKLCAMNDANITRQRHLMYFVSLAERAEPTLRSFDMETWLDMLETELDNIRSALAYGLKNDAESELRLASSLWWFWHIRGHKSEGCEWLEQGLAIEEQERGENPFFPARALIRGKALYVAGFLRIMLYEIDKGTSLSEESLLLFRQYGMEGKRGAAYALWNLAAVADRQLDFRHKKTRLEESLALFQELNDKFGVAQCMDGLAFCALDENNYEEARILLEENLALRQEMGDKDGSADALHHLGVLSFQESNYKQAGAYYRASLALFRGIKNRWGISHVLSSLGRTAQAEGNYEEATTILEEALSLEEEVSDRFGIASRLNQLGLVAQSQGDYERAAQMHEQALGLFHEGGNRISASTALYNLGFTALLQSDYKQAAANFEEALTICHEAGDKFGTAWALYGMGEVERSQGSFGSARDLNRAAIAIFRMVGDPTHMSQHAQGVAYCLEASASLAFAEKQMKRAICLFSVSQKLYSPLRFEMSAAKRSQHDQAVISARRALGEDKFAAMWEMGEAMTLEEAITYPLEET
jgi:predicted ATPase/DNA-binding XRE family transcriptional regulator/Tfp pilus assembly protein PilF